MGRDFDGGYAEYTCVPASQVQVVKTQLPWETLGSCVGDAADRVGSLFRSPANPTPPMTQEASIGISTTVVPTAVTTPEDRIWPRSQS
jgi:hypothetical protein